MKNSPIDGQEAPFAYTTYLMWSDFYNISDIQTFWWVMIAVSLMGPLGLFTNIVVSVAMQIFVGYVGYTSYQQSAQYENFEKFALEIENMLALAFGFINITCNLMILYTLLPIAGPILNFILAMYVPTELQRLTIPVRFTIDKIYG